MAAALALRSLARRAAAFAPASPVPREWLFFALQTTAASLVALYLAILIDLEEPKWAAMTVWIVASGSRGMSVSKSWYRLLGTLAGAGVAIALIGAFAQAPELFFVALAAWLALCTWTATALRNFRSYAAVLSGYTAAIIALSASSRPEAVFDVAVARVTYIALGVVVEATFSSFFHPSDPLTEVRARLDEFARRAASLTARALRAEDNSAALQGLFAAAPELDSAGEFAAANSARTSRRFGHLRGAIAAALAQLAAAQNLREYLGRRARPGGPALEAATVWFDAAAQGRVDPQAAEALRARLRAAPKEDAELAFRLELLLDRALETSRRQALFVDPRGPASRMAFRFHVDYVAAAERAARAFVSVLAAAGFWVVTAWPSGAGLVTIVAVLTSLFSTLPNAVAAGVGFLEGAVAAIIVAAFYNFTLLPRTSDFAMLALLLAPALLCAGVAIRSPRLGASATSFATFLWDQVNPQNPARTDIESFLNGALVLVIGVVCGALAYAMLFPADPLKTRARLHAAVRRDLRSMAREPAAWTAHAWHIRMADRFSRQIATDAQVAPERREQELRGMLAALTIGHCILALQALSAGEAASRTIRRVLAGLGEGRPRRVARAARLAARGLDRRAQELRAAGGDAREARLLDHGALLLDDMAESALAHAAFLEKTA